MPVVPEISSSAFSYRDDASVPDFDDSHALFVFDAVCVLCSSGARWLMRYDNSASISFTSAQGALGRALYQHYGIDMNESYLVIIDGRAFTASRGYLELTRRLGGWWNVLRITSLLPESLRDWFYALIASNRYRWFGKTDYCALLTQEQRRRLL